MTIARSTQQEELYEKIRSHLAKLNFQYGFADRLAKENYWSIHFALAVVEEYAKFLFIAREGGHPVSPPPAIDKAWHLHLLHSAQYWGEFCPNILQMQLHHAPESKTPGESEQFKDWFQQTLASYTKFFGIPPVPWTGPRRAPVWVRGATVFLLFLAGAALVMGVMGVANNKFDLTVFAAFVIIGSIFLALFNQARSGGSGRKADGSCGSTSGMFGCSSDSGSHGGHGCGHHGCGGGHSGCGGGSSCGGGGCGGGGH